MDEQTTEIASLREESTADPSPKFVRHTVTATVHRLRQNDASRSVCGIGITGSTFRARRMDSKTYLPLDKLDDIPGILLCDRCLHDERARALERELIDAAISGDEVED